MKKTIGVVGLTSNENIGDYLLVEATKYLIRDYNPDVAFVDIDIDPREPRVYRGNKKIHLKIFEALNRFEKPLLKLIPFKRFAYHYRYFYWWLKLNWHYQEKIDGIDALIFTGGGFIKFKTQGLNYLDELVLKVAKKRNIPVMFNAVGVEGYSDTDIRSQKLKKALNFDNVKMITTRDDIDTLKNKYLDKKDTVSARVGDPVFWLREMYAYTKPISKSDAAKIGINLINPNNFSNYGGSISRDSVVNFYKNLIIELKERKADFYLFSNGMDVDQRFGSLLVESMNLRKDQLLPVPVTSAEFIDILSSFDVILSARMHAGISAYALDIPVVGLIWGEKLQFLTEITGLRDRYFNEDELDHIKIADMLIKNNMKLPDKKKREALRNQTIHYLYNFLDSLEGEVGHE